MAETVAFLSQNDGRAYARVWRLKNSLYVPPYHLLYYTMVAIYSEFLARLYKRNILLILKDNFSSTSIRRGFGM